MYKQNNSLPFTPLGPSGKNVSLKNWHIICRSCLCEIEDEHYSMEETYLDRKLFDIYENVTCLKVLLLNTLPGKLCPPCYREIIRFDSFKNGAVESERLLLAATTVQGDDKNLPENNFEVINLESLERAHDGEVQKNESDDDFPLSEDPAAENEREDYSEGDHKKPIKIEKTCLVGELTANSVPKIKTKTRGRRRTRISNIKGEERPGKNNKELCPECGKEVLSYRLDDHVRTHTKEKPFDCKICDSKFADRSNLRRHMKLHLNYRPFICEFCGKDFIRPSSKKIHVLTAHKQEKDAFCPICHKAFKHEIFVKKHMAFVHNKSDDPNEKVPSEHPCVRCDKVYKFKSSLYAHQKLHVDPRPFLCNTCGKTFSTKANLQNHQRIHTGEMIFDCAVCERKFRTLSTLKTHELVHKGEKPLRCQFCDKRFRQHAHLRTHVRGQHDGERPYACDYCGKKFKQSSNLRVHIRLHTGETPYKCDVCGKGFYDSSRLKRHNKRHENVVVDMKLEEKSSLCERSTEEPSLPSRTGNNWPEF